MPIHAELEAVRRGGDAAAGHSAAGELNYDNIGDRIEFYWHFPDSGVLAHIGGELRQIHHDGNHTTIAVTGWPERGTDLTEFTLTHDAPVEVFDER